MQVPRTRSKIVRHPLNDVRNLKRTDDTDKRNLRERKVKNYRDSSLSNASINKSTSVDNTERVPVYLKTVTNVDDKEEKDPFEFINDTPENQKKKKHKIRKQHRLPLGSKKGTKKPKDDSWSSDSSFHMISKAVKRAERKKVNAKAKIAKPNKNASSVTENNKNNLAQTQTNQVFVNVGEHITPLTNLSSLVVERNYLVNRLMESSQFEGVNNNNISAHKVTDKSKELTNVESKNLLDLHTKLVVQNNMNYSLRESFRKSVEVTMVKEDDQFFGFDDENEDSTNNLSDIHSTPTSKKNTTIESKGLSAVTEKFKSLTSTPLRKANVAKRKKVDSNTIKIHSNIVLSSPLFKAPQQIPNHNETRQNETVGCLGFDNSNRRTVQRSPWRNDSDSLVRNPHFLQMKNTSLPCYNQEMVLDERLERSISSKTPKHCDELDNSAKSLLQTSIVDYFNSSSLIIENSPAQKITNQTLFDNDQLSPLKNDSIQGGNNDRSRAKRNILGPLNNVQNVSLLKSGNEESFISDSSVESTGVDKCFGFDDEDKENNDEDKENKRKKIKFNYKKKDKVGPMRYSLSELKKIREAALQDVSVGDIIDVSGSIEPTVEVLPADKSQEEETTVGLFEDLIEIPDPKSYARKRPRRQRIPSFEAEEEPIENDKLLKRKKRDVRTKSEEEKLNKWAEEFNAMCEEVNQHELETV